MFLRSVVTLLHRVCDHRRRKVKDSKTSCPENCCEPDCERACHVTWSQWWHDVCIWSDSRLKQTDLLSLWHWRYPLAEGIWFTQNKSAAVVNFTLWVFVCWRCLPKVCRIKSNSKIKMLSGHCLWIFLRFFFFLLSLLLFNICWLTVYFYPTFCSD